MRTGECPLQSCRWEIRETEVWLALQALESHRARFSRVQPVKPNVLVESGASDKACQIGQAMIFLFERRLDGSGPS